MGGAGVLAWLVQGSGGIGSLKEPLVEVPS